MYSQYKYQRILYHSLRGLKPYSIAKPLRGEGLCASRNGIARFLKKRARTGTTAVLPGAGPPSKITPEMKALLDAQMERDDEATAMQFHHMLVEKGYKISVRTVASLGGHFMAANTVSWSKTPTK